MCIINGPVTSVNATNIFAGPSDDRTRQLTVYSNKVDTAAENSMILPVPFPDSVVLHDLSYYPNLFTDLKRCFKTTRPLYKNALSANGYEHMARGAARERPKLVVHRVGSYEASIVPSIDDFDRLSEQFKLSPDVANMLTTDYTNIQGAPVGFVVCRLIPGAHEYHPFAYSHTLPGKYLFIPTKHFHPHEPEPVPQYTTSITNLGLRSHRKPNHGDDWDHVVYTAATDLDTHDEDQLRFDGSSMVKWQKLPAEFRSMSALPLSRWSAEGHHKNIDLQPVCTAIPPKKEETVAPATTWAEYIHSYWT